MEYQSEPVTIYLALTKHPLSLQVCPIFQTHSRGDYQTREKQVK